MSLILNAVRSGIPEMKFGKKYSLKQIVEFGEPGLWGAFNRYDLSCIGRTFAMYVGNTSLPSLSLVENRRNPVKYVRNF